VCVCGFCMILRVNNDSLLNSVNQPIFVMVKCCVFFAVRAEFLTIIYTSFSFKRLTCLNTSYLEINSYLRHCMPFVRRENNRTRLKSLHNLRLASFLTSDAEGKAYVCMFMRGLGSVIDERKHLGICIVNILVLNRLRQHRLSSVITAVMTGRRAKHLDCGHLL
jgi:hypothetical protein